MRIPSVRTAVVPPVSRKPASPAAPAPGGVGGQRSFVSTLQGVPSTDISAWGPLSRAPTLRLTGGVLLVVVGLLLATGVWSGWVALRRGPIVGFELLI